MPPPNVTGSLHMGHALDNTIQDTLIRFWRMRGRAVLWQPGTDHAGIATQMVVERQLEREQSSRRKIGRQAFVERVWAWKEESGGRISQQLHRLGASADWSRERFTLDEGLSQAVRKVFVDLYRDGLIYKDQRLVNWDCRLQTAVSDLEVEATEVQGHLWYIRYPIEGQSGRHITVATTRPETMLGDTAVAVHPDDPRYQDLIGRHAILPLVGRRLPIVADPYSDPEKGSGAVKITPAHDFNDFEVGRRHGLEMISILDTEGRLNDQVPEAYRGLDRFVARERVVAGPRGPGPDRESRKNPAQRALQPAFRDAGRADAERSVVRRRQDAGRRRDPRGRGRPHPVRAAAVGRDLLRVDAQHPALVHLAPALVGPSDPGLVRPGRPGVRRHGRGRRGMPRRASTMAGRSSSSATRTCSTPGSPPASGRSRRSAGPSPRPSFSASTRPACWSPASTSSSSGSRG